MRHVAQQRHTLIEVGAILRCHEKTLHRGVEEGVAHSDPYRREAEI